MLGLILIKTRNAPIPTMKIRQRNYLESEKFFSKFLYFLERENFQNLKVRIPKPKSESENFQESS